MRQIDVHELSRRIRGGERLFLLDVRQPWEHERAAIAGSVLVPLDEIVRRAAEIEPPSGATMVVYCHHGVRSLSAAALLARLGHEDVVSLRGGIDAWSVEIDPGVPRY